MYDLHTHTFFSDGVLIPSELVWRGKLKGYRAMAITDHADESNIDFIVPRIIKISRILTSHYDITVIPGIELTYVPPVRISALAKRARNMGSKIIVVHGETPAENVPPGTNSAALASRIDILAHPGKMSERDAKVAKKNGISLEITSRSGHCMTNRHVLGLALKYGIPAVFSTDSHSPEDLRSFREAEDFLKKQGIERKMLNMMLNNSETLVKKVMKKAKDV